MARITHLSLFQLPPASARAPRRLVVGVHADDVVGWAACLDARGRWEQLERLGASLIGHAPHDTNRRHAALGLAGPPLTQPGDLAVPGALDSAALDLAAKVAGAPLALWLGGNAQPRVRVADRIAWTDAPAALADDAKIGWLVDRARARVEAFGFGALSVRPGKAAAPLLLNLLGRLRFAFAHRVTLRIDLSAGYPASETRALAVPARGLGVDLLMLRGRSVLGGALPIAVGPDPSLHQAMLGGLAQAVRWDVGAHGGAALALRLASLLRVFQLELLLSGTTGLAIELALLGQLARATPTDLQPLDYAPDATALAPLAVRDGLLVLPDGPGLGVPVDVEALARTAQRRTEVRAKLAAAS